jgi:hypothetical protein
MILTKEYINSLDKLIYKNVDSCLDHFANLELEKDEVFWDQYSNENPYYYHVYWYGKLSNKQWLCINSYFATQNNNKTKLIVWIDHENNTTIQELQIKYQCPRIIFKIYKPCELAKDTPFEGHDFINVNKLKYIKYRSDFARVMILYHYGGIYYDFDMILFKDLSPFLHLEFCYQWSNIDGRGNNGLLSLQKGGKMGFTIMNKYIDQIENKLKPLTLDFNRVIFDINLGLTQLPCSLFDPCWILLDANQKSKYSKLDNFDNFFKRTDENIDKFFDNKIYSYHWHSRIEYDVEPDSYFKKIENKMTYNINLYFDKIFVINLDSRKDRWDECLDLFKKYGITNYERFSAVNLIFKDIPLNLYDKFIVGKKDWYVPGAVGCKLSHFNIIKLAKERGYDKILIIEDDFSIQKSIYEFNNILNDSLIELDNKWDMLYLGGNNLKKPTKINKNKYIHKAIEVNTTHAYAIRSSIYNKCVEEILECGTEIDDYYKRNIQGKTNCYCIYPSLVKQRESISDIFKGSLMKYNFD